MRDPDVLNTLIDQFSVETVLLIEKRPDASYLMERVRPPKVTKVSFSSTLLVSFPDWMTLTGLCTLQAYTIEGDEVQCGRFYSNKRKPLGIIKASVDDAVR